ncbi:MAG: class A beta-lactamase-related serine hydrolase [Candidatus Omnitrophica bacterium]|nr:class A beta-lactamase-related serine hydrolase [Candidatus Omnitrophota bacterium]
MKRKIIILTVILITACSGGAFFSYKMYGKYRELTKEQTLLKIRKDKWENLKKAIEHKVVNFRGTAGIVVEDLDSEWEIAFNKDTLIPAASLVKIPIMLSCFYAAQDGKISLEDTASLKNSQRVSGSRALGDVPSGSVFTVKELLKPMITQSDNTAANLLIDLVGFDALNGYFKKMGLKSTNLARKMMDFKERSEGEENYTTAQDMALLLERMYHNDLLNKDVSEECLQLLGQQKINDRIPRKLPKNGTFIAHKTGLERHVCHDVGIVYTDKGNFLICVLAKHEDRFARSAKRFISDIALLTYNYYQNPD